MKKLFLFCFMSVGLLLSTTSCSEKEVTKKLPTSAIIVEGDNADLLTFAADSFEVKLTKNANDYWRVFIELPLKNKYKWDDLDKELNKGHKVGDKGFKIYEPEFGNISILPLDSVGEIFGFALYGSNFGFYKDTLTTLINSVEFTEKNLHCYCPDSYYEKPDYKEIKEFFDKINSIKIENVTLETQYTPSVEENCNAILDRYEDFVDRYIQAYKKYKKHPTNLESYSEFMELSDDCTRIYKEASSKECRATKNFVTRLNRIHQKFAKGLY